jgi:S-disulfanyl-L-cysteine oxidoreductase SoxD
MNPRSFAAFALALAAWLGAVAPVQPRAQGGRTSGGTGLSEPTPTGNRGPSGLGRPLSARELSAWDISIGPDGAELPPGSGNATQGALAFTQRACSTCHGPTGKEGPAPVLVGGKGGFEESYYPIVTWPFATMIWDFIHRAMPYDRPGRLSPDESYALTAFLLYRNGIIQEDDVMDAKSLPKVLMPHRSEYKVPDPWTPGTPRGLQNKIQK